MKIIQATARLKINEDKLEEFQRIAADCLSIAREKDENILQYDWFFDPDKKVCVVRECHANSEAALAHLGNLGNRLQKLMEVADFSLEIFGEPSKQLRETTADLDPEIYSFYQGL